MDRRTLDRIDTAISVIFTLSAVAMLWLMDVILGRY